MRIRLVALTIGLSLIAPSIASGQQVPQRWINLSVSAAQHYWHNDYPTWSDPRLPTAGCHAVPSVAWSDLGQDGGEADFMSCTIRLTTATTWTPYFFCIAFVHEWGHLTLGPWYFRDVNPSDPSHNPKPNTVMNAVPYNARVGGCYNMESQLPSHRHVRHTGHGSGVATGRG